MGAARTKCVRTCRRGSKLRVNRSQQTARAPCRVTHVISWMNRAMREMEVDAMPRWNELPAVLRHELRVMPEMRPLELESFVAEHGARVMLGIEMHRK